MAERSIHMPGAFGGLTRYNEEYKSKFTLDPKHVIILVIAIILFVIFLNLFFPIA